MRKKVGEFYRDEYPPLQPFTESRARTDFTSARNYAISLIDIHDLLTGGKVGRPRQDFEALKRSALILAVTAWESFVEDTLTQKLEELLAKASIPNEMSRVFNHAAHQWLDGAKHAPDLAAWTGTGWKDLIRASLRKAIDKFHSPDTENTKRLFGQYLGIKIDEHWSWRGATPQQAQKQLDALIRVRGRAVHRGRTMHPLSKPEPSMQRQTVIKALNLVYNLMHATETALGVGSTSHGFSGDVPPPSI